MTSRSMPGRVRTREQLLGAGWRDWDIRRAVRAGTLHPVFPGTFVLDGAAAVATADLLECARARFGSDIVAVLDTAASIHGLPASWPVDPRLHVALPPGREQFQRPAIRFHTWALDEDEVCERNGVRVTTVGRTVTDLMCTTDRLSAVAVLDAALAAGHLGTTELDSLRSSTRGRRGAARSRPWWLEADGRAESPLETRVRLRASDGGYPPHEVQLRRETDGRRYYVDLAWRQPNGRWLCVEADGRDVHSAPDAVFADRLRSNAITASGNADIVRVTWADTVRPRTIPALLERFLGPPRK